MRSALLLLLLACALHLPGLGRAELENEEGRRLLPARELLERGDWVLPTIWEQPYLAKPPLHYVTVAGAARALDAIGHEAPSERRAGWWPERHGPVSPLAVRMPSWLAALATAWLLLAAGRALGSTRAGTWAGVLFLLSPEVARKARLGEIEQPLAFLCFATGWLLWRAACAERGAWWRGLGGGVVLGAAVLTKGPIALLFGLPPALAGARSPAAAARALLLGLVGAVAVAAAWLVPLWLRFEDRDELLALWAGEVGRGGAGGLGVYLSDRWRFVSGTLLGWLPASGLVLWELARARRADRHPALGRVLAAGALAYVVLFCWPSVRPRYALPLVPWVALAGGLVAARWSAGRLAAGKPAVARGAWAFLALLFVARAVQLFGTEPPRWDRERRIESALVLDARAGDVLWTDLWERFNALAYCEAEVRFARSPDEVPVGAALLRRAEALPDLSEDARWEPIDLADEAATAPPDLIGLALWRRRDG